jgi:hypothetical protein
MQKKYWGSIVRKFISKKFPPTVSRIVSLKFERNQFSISNFFVLIYLYLN